MDLTTTSKFNNKNQAIFVALTQFNQCNYPGGEGQICCHGDVANDPRQKLCRHERNMLTGAVPAK